MTHPIPSEAFRHHIACLGKTGSGKTTTAKGIVEQIIRDDPNARICILDPIKSDWWGLTSSASGKRAGLPFVILGGPRGHVPLHDGAGAVIGELAANGSLPLSIIDMADFGMGGLQRFFNDFAPALLRHMRGVIHLVLEEAHEFAPKERMGASGENMTLYHAKKLATAGRSKGIRMMLVTQRTQQLHNALLGSCETMVAHRFNLPADQKPIKDWLKVNFDKETFERVGNSLSSLKTGTGWVCSGELKFAELVQFPSLTTFDNSATPAASDGAAEVTTAPVDRTALLSLVGEAVKKADADDPVKLRARIKELEAKNEALAINDEPPREPDEHELQAAHDEGYKAGYKAGAIDTSKRDAGCLEDAVSQCANLHEYLTAAVTAWKDGLPPHGPAAINSEPPRNGAMSFGMTKVMLGTPTREIRIPQRMAEGISGPQQRMLDALAWLKWCGVNEADKPRLAMLADISVKSSGFKANLSALSSGGYINRNGDRISLTNAGHSVANKPSGQPTNQVLHDAIRQRVSAPQWKMLERLIHLYPRQCPKEFLATNTDQSITSSGFKANLSVLSSLGFIVRERGSDDVAAAPILFVEKRQ